MPVSSYTSTTLEARVGIGVALRVDQETLPIRVQEVVQDTPAAKAGLKPGSWIVSDNGTNTVGKTVNECAGMIRGAVGAEVKLEIVAVVQNASANKC